MTGRGSGRGSVGSLSPILSSSGSPRAPNRSPAGIKRRPASFHARTPRTPRPNDLKVTPISRMLNTPTSVDSLPRLRRFNSSQTQQSSFAYLSHDEGVGGRHNQDLKGEKDDSKNKEEMVVKSSDEEKCKEKTRERLKERTESKEESTTSEVLCQPVSEIKGGVVSQSQDDKEEKKDLVEVPLSRLKPPAGRGPENTEKGEKGGESYGDDQKMCCGFFFKVS